MSVRRNISMSFILCVCLLTSCKKKGETPPQQTLDVYALGTIGSPPDAIKPVYWKNGQLITLQAPNSVNVITHTMAQHGTDVYTAGSYEATNGKVQAAYWKNGVLKDLSGGFIASNINNIAFKGDDVYMFGYVNSSGANNDVALVIWKNDIPTLLPKIPTVQYYVDMVFNGNDMYLLVDAGTVTNTQVAGYLKNGVLVKVRDTTSSSDARAMAVSGNDVYMCGNAVTNQTVVPVYWKNGIKMPLAANGEAGTNAIAVSGNDVYVAGSNSGATVWKNGQVIFHDPGLLSNTSSIVINKGDVYVGGQDQSGNAVIWKNGKVMQLPSGTNEKSRVERVALIQH